jgi:protein-S-isoprenylcysteine O-methyltransferase Ste14
VNSELTFRASLAVIGVMIYAIRFYYFGLTAKSGDRVSKGANKFSSLAIGAIGLMAMVAPMAYVFTPRWLEWAALPMPGTLRWAGVGLGLLSVPLLFWIHRTLDKNYDMPQVIKEGQTLVTSGPYRWVRHPMYSSFFLSGLATFLITANWFIGLVFCVYCLVAASMVGAEESNLIEKFGDEYQAYRQHTGRFLPRLY